MKWTLVTGAAIRLGAEICLTLARQGHSILIHYHTHENEALQLANECIHLGVQAEIIQGDFSTTETIDHFLKKITQVEYIVHNVGNYVINGPENTPIEVWKDLFQTNLFAPIQITNFLLPMIKKQKGRIVMIGSTGLSSIYPDIYATAYAESKLALYGYTKALALSVVKQNVTVNMVSPGMLENAVDKNERILPMKRAGTVSEVARVVAFLFEPQNGYITGQNIEVAGALKL